MARMTLSEDAYEALAGAIVLQACEDYRTARRKLKKNPKNQDAMAESLAAIMGLDRAIRCGNQNTESVYDERGILFIDI